MTVVALSPLYSADFSDVSDVLPELLKVGRNFSLHESDCDDA